MSDGSCFGCKFWRSGFADWYEARDQIRKQEKNVSGNCTFYPTWVQTESGHYCAQFQPRHFDFSYRKEVWGDWWEQRAVAAEEKNTKLIKELKAARKISAARLARLRSKAKPNGPDESTVSC